MKHHPCERHNPAYNKKLHWRLVFLTEWIDEKIDDALDWIYMTGIRLGTNKYAKDHPEYRRWRR